MTHTSIGQPEALRLADALRDGEYSLYQERAATEAELRRLHARVQELADERYAIIAEKNEYKVAFRAVRLELEASQAQRVPLTDAQIHDWWRSENSLEDCDMCRFEDFAQVVRAFELKYGITQEQS